MRAMREIGLCLFCLVGAGLLAGIFFAVLFIACCADFFRRIFRIRLVIL